MDGTLTKPNLILRRCTSIYVSDATPSSSAHCTHYFRRAPCSSSPHTTHENRRFRTDRRRGVDMSEDILGAVAAMPPAERAAATAVIDEMEAEGRRTLEVMPGAVELLRWLHAHEVPTALVTRNTRADRRAPARRAVGAARLAPFSPAISRDDDLPAKRDPAALAASRARGARAPSGELLMVGDAGERRRVRQGGRRGDRAARLGPAHRRGRRRRRRRHRRPPARESAARALRAVRDRLGARGPAAQIPDDTDAAERSEPCGRGGRRSRARGDGTRRVRRARRRRRQHAARLGGGRGSAPAVEALLDKGVAVNARGYLGATACARACRAGHVDVLAALLERPAATRTSRTTRCRARCTSPRSRSSPRRSSSCSPRRPSTHSCSTARAARPPRTQATRRSARRSAPRRTRSTPRG